MQIQVDHPNVLCAELHTQYVEEAMKWRRTLVVHTDLDSVSRTIEQAEEIVGAANRAMGAKAQEQGLHGWPDWHIMGPDGWCGTVVRHTGMFAVTSKMYPLTFLKEMYDLDEAAKRACGLWDAEHSPQHDSYVTRDLAIKEEYFVFYNPYDDNDVGKLRKWMGMVQQFSNERGVV